jgi:hypothetical protein
MQVSPGACSRGKCLKGIPLRQALALFVIIRLRLEAPASLVNFRTGFKARDKRSGLKCLFGIDGEKSFITSTPGVNVIKTFFLHCRRQSQISLLCLYLAITFQSSLTFAGNTRSLAKKEAPERSSGWVCSGLVLKF